VFQAIPEYRKILAEKLTEKDARYSILMLRATKKFKAAVEAAAGAEGCDLVGNLGSVTWKGHVIPDVTETTLLKLEEAAKAAR